MSFTGRLYAFGRALAAAAPSRIQGRLLKLKPFSMQSGIWHLPEQGIVYVMIHKVATRSILAALTSFAAGEHSPATFSEVQQAAKRYQRGAFPPEIRALNERCFTFAFVRNPLDRLLSAYSQQMAASEREKTIFRQHKIPFDASFAEFVRAVAALPDEGCNVHVRSQHRFVTDARGIVVEFAGKIERIDEGWAGLSARFGLPPLPRRNISDHPPYTDAYTPELARLAADRYAHDIQLFGYGSDVARLTA